MERYIVLGHGSRNHESNQVVKSAAELLQQQINQAVIPAFLQFEHPTLETAIEESISKGYSTINIVPMFLYPGVHMKRDIPGILSKQQAEYPEITFKLGEPIGTDPQLINILQARAETAKIYHGN